MEPNVQLPQPGKAAAGSLPPSLAICRLKLQLASNLPALPAPKLPSFLLMMPWAVPHQERGFSSESFFTFPYTLDKCTLAFLPYLLKPEEAYGLSFIHCLKDARGA